MRVSYEALAKEDWSFGGLRRTAGATGSYPRGSTVFGPGWCIASLFSTGLGHSNFGDWNLFRASACPGAT